MVKYPLYSALTYLFDTYDIELDEDLFETWATAAYKKIGNKEFKLKILRAHPERDVDGGWSVCKPCDMDEIEAITLPYEVGQTVSATNDFLAVKTYTIENWIEQFKRNRDELYLSGAFVKYREFGDKIYFTEPYDAVNILYKALYTDDDGLPQVTLTEMEAIAAYCAYSYDLKKARKSKDQSLMQIAQLEYQTWAKLCSKARVAESFSQNEINEILDTLTSFDVHKHGVSSTKPIN